MKRRWCASPSSRCCLLARPEFYRRAGLLEAPLSWEWLLAISVAVIASLWVGMAAYQNVSYKNALWWHFAYGGDAPRFLRASLGVAVAGMLFALHRIFHSAHPGEKAGRPLGLDSVRPIIDAMPRTDVQLALLGDKCFLPAEDGQGFVMYGVQGSTWLAMGDPVAQDEKSVAELIWRFKERADLHNGKPAFYQISSAYIPLYIDAGFSLAKLGEDAFVDLSQFTLEGGEGRKWRAEQGPCRAQGTVLRDRPGRRGARHPARSETGVRRLACRARREGEGLFARFLVGGVSVPIRSGGGAP